MKSEEEKNATVVYNAERESERATKIHVVLMRIWMGAKQWINDMWWFFNDFRQFFWPKATLLSLSMRAYKAEENY